ncbi:hypothetical protein B0T16DRAFT_417729 [Cercophora newfieldiana]|uniref:Secreted protein n=1 Tax=Cercophora newfieldiana TaxID=92897 RepID=A0AA40CPF4_9PEZI|nr:hypothetical protein B0T16DRAFT_417729 [Cercophora newfieldiana]
MTVCTPASRSLLRSFVLAKVAVIVTVAAKTRTVSQHPFVGGERMYLYMLPAIPPFCLCHAMSCCASFTLSGMPL